VTLRDLMRRVPLSELGLVEPGTAAVSGSGSGSSSGSSSASSSFEALGRLSLEDDGAEKREKDEEENEEEGREKSKQLPKISYLDVAEDSAAALGVFVLPPRAAIPLHNHPGMTVSSRVLFGRLHVRSFDWASGSESEEEEEEEEEVKNGDGGGDREKENSSDSERRGPTATTAPTTTSKRDQRRRAGLRRARLVEDRIVDASSLPTQLTPKGGGNIHAFANAGPSGHPDGGSAPCAVLDLLAPPYCAEDDRDCTYYVEEEAFEGDEEEESEEEGTAAAAAENDGGSERTRKRRGSPASGAKAGRRATRPGDIALLRAVPAPADFVVEHAPYRGIRPAAAAAV